MFRYIAFILFSTSLLFCFAQTGLVNAEESETLPEVVVTATRNKTKIFNTPYSASTVDAEEIQTVKIRRTTPQIFADDPTVMVQKTGYGQSSPFIRGFTGYRTLLLIDGIRLNNSVFRNGPNQYWNTVDPFTISKLELIKGQGSVLYGSDAIGGTVNAISRSRNRFFDNTQFQPRVVYRFGSADLSNQARVELGGNINRKLGILFGGNFKDFNEVSGGRYVGLQQKTGYREIDFDFKAQYFLNPDSNLVLAWQRVDQDDAWRSHKTIYGISWEGTSIGSEKLRSLNQNRDLIYLQYHGKNLPYFFKQASISISYHLQKESQFRIKSNDSSDLAGFNVGTLGLWAQANSPTPIGKLTYGFDYYHDFVDSSKTKFNADGSLNSVEIQGPVADNSHYDLLGFFIQDELTLWENFDITLGVRYTFAAVKAGKLKDPTSGNQISFSDSWHNIVGSLRLLYHIGNNWNVYSGISQGVRAPNLSDLTRLDSARTDEIETPSPGLKPEKFLTAETGLKTEYGLIRAELSYYYTRIFDGIIRYPTGNMVDGDNEVQKANVGDGFVTGIEFKSDITLASQWLLFFGLAWQYGEEDTYPTSAQLITREPVSRMMPLNGILGLRWMHSSKKFWTELSVRMATKQTRLSTRDISDTQRIPPQGTPGYIVSDIKTGFKITKYFTLSLAVENITNEDYRIHGSGQNESGINFLASADLKF